MSERRPERRRQRWWTVVGASLGGALVVALLLPLVALALSTTPQALRAGLDDPMFWPATWLSLRTSALSLALIVLSGTPLAWWLGRSRTRLARAVEWTVDLPVVIPPAVIGLGLLYAFGPRGVLGAWLAEIGVQVPFTAAAVVLAQVVVAAPFYVQAASSAFREVDTDMLVVARTLGASRAGAFVRVALPVAAPGLIAGASLAWARALGEFGATLLFAGNMPGTTQTMPLAIYYALESDVRVAVVLAIVMAGFGGVLLGALRLTPAMWAYVQRPRVPGGRRERL